jgi:ubiquinone/menaquinone biosynthesis C-methylase UbiE
MSEGLEKELDRIKEEYARRDSSGQLNIYSYQNPAFAFHMKEREQTILKMLKKENINLPNCDVLEVGCGTGHILQRFLEFGTKTSTGIDLMQNRIEEGQKSYPRVKLLQGDASHLPFENEQFDLVMQFMCLSSVLDSNMRKQIANEMWRVLKPGGDILFYDMRPCTYMHGLVFKLIGLFRGVLKKLRRTAVEVKNENIQTQRATPIHLFDLKEIKELFPRGSMHYQSASLDFNLASVAAKSYLLAYALSCLPFLRTHSLVTIRK